MQYSVWHGTNQTFDHFSDTMLGLSTNNPASTQAFFFAATPETSWEYAQSAARKLIPDQNLHEERVAVLLKQARDAEARGKFSLYEDLICEAEELDFGALQAPPAGSVLLSCAVSMANPFVTSGRDRSVLVDLGGVLDQARLAGHDGVIIADIDDTPSGVSLKDDHYAVFSADQITIKARAFSLEAAHDLTLSTEPDLDEEPSPFG